MLRASITFFVLGLISMLLGINSIAGLSIDIGKILLFVFLVLSVISFVLGRSGKSSAMIAIVAFMTSFLLTPQFTYADDSVKETAKEMANDSVRETKQAVRVIKDKTCEMINGKMECAVQKAKHAVQRGSDKVEDAID